MTLVVAVIDPMTGAVSLGADTKVTWARDETRTRRVYTEPALKIVLLGDDLVVGYAGDGPEMLAEAVSTLGGLGVDEVLARLARIEGASFVVGQRRPARIWSASAERGIEERTAIRRAWAGDVTAFSTFQARFDDDSAGSALDRLQSTMSHIVHLARPESVGGFAIFATGSADGPFRYHSVQSMLWPESMEAEVTIPTANDDGTGNFTLRATYSEMPLMLHVVPGAEPTRGALGVYVQNAGLGYLYPQALPAQRVQVRARSLEEFVHQAGSEYGQALALGGACN